MRNFNYKTISLTLCLFIIFVYTQSNISENEINIEGIKKKYSVLREYLPAAGREIFTPDFWLKISGDAEQLILTTQGIQALNRRVYKNGYRVHPFYENKSTSGALIRRYLRDDLNWISGFYKYDSHNNRIYGNRLYPKLELIMNISAVPEKVINRFCIVVAPVYIRAFPTNIMIMKKKNNYPFDILQKSSLDIGQEVTLFHLSADKQWGYVQTAFTTGWVSLHAIAWTNKEAATAFINTESFIIAAKPRVHIYSDRECTKDTGFIRLGSRLPLQYGSGEETEVLIPWHRGDNLLLYKKGYIQNKSFILTNYLPMTKKNVITIAFEMLGEPYGWGESGFNTDCSSYLTRVCAVFGLDFPRSSYNQVSLLNPVYKKDKKKTQFPGNIPAAKTILYYQNPGHVMLYLGKYENTHYAIHNMWSFFRPRTGKAIIHQPENSADEEIMVQGVVVTPLTLGEKSFHGSLQQQINIIGEF